MKSKSCQWLLFALRIVAAAALLVAGAMKLGMTREIQSVSEAPLVFALTMQSFKLVPNAVIPFATYYFPWLEVITGLMLALGVWSRQSGTIATVLLGVFTLALASVLLRGMDVDCGCFGGLFGEAKITWTSIARNGVLIACAFAVACYGGGVLSVTKENACANAPSQ